MLNSQTYTALDIQAFKEKMKDDGVTILDTRQGPEFTEGFVPGSVNIGLDGRFAEWASILVPLDKPVLLVSDNGTEQDAANMLAQIGFSNISGYLSGGFDAWRGSGENIDLVINVEADELAMDIPHDDHLVILDVRRETEYGNGHVQNAVNIPLDEMTDPAQIAGFEENENIYIHCGSGYRSVIAASLLKRHGIHNIRNVVGGFDKISEQGRITIVKENSVLN